MADRIRLRFAAVVDGRKDGAKNLCGHQSIAWKHRAILDIVETTVFRVQELQNNRAADNVIPVRQRNSEVFKSTVIAKLDPPGRLHKSCFRRSFHEAVPRGPSVCCVALW